jgi:hypothetical protein
VKTPGSSRSDGTELDDGADPPGGSQNFGRAKVNVLDSGIISQAGQDYVCQFCEVCRNFSAHRRELCSRCLIAIVDRHRKSGGDQAARDTRPKVSESDESEPRTGGDLIRRHTFRGDLMA